MGYQKLTLGEGFNWVAPQFLTVGGTPINIQDLQLDFGDGEALGGDNLQILDEGGATIVTYNWFPGDWMGTDKDGWFDENSELANVTLDSGMSVLINCDTDGTVVKIFGEVGTADYETTAVAGFNFVGNTTPVTINIQDIQLDFGNGEAQGGDNLQLLDNGGATVTTYNWFPGDWMGTSTDGWYDENSELADVELAPGQGVLINADTDGTIISVPSAL